MPLDRDRLADRIADAEDRLRQSIAQRIERNRTELSRLQQEQELFESSSSEGRASSAPASTTRAVATGAQTPATP